MIKIENLTIILQSFRIIDLCLAIDEGQFHFLLGPTGSGKTLILESIIGLRKPLKGRICVGDKEVQDLPPEQRQISYVPQDLALFPHLTVKENILFGIKARNLDWRLYEGHVQALIEAMRIDSLLAPKPKLLILDEPLSGLDPSIKADIQHLLKNLHASFHPTTLCVTHDFEEAYFLGDEITVFIDGKVEQAGKKEEVFLKPASRKVAQFLGATNLYRAFVLAQDEQSQRWILGIDGARVSVPMYLCRNPLQVGMEVDLFIRPEEVMILRKGKPVKESLRKNVFEGKILDIMDRGRDYLTFFQTSKEKIPFEISIPSYAFRNLSLSTGQTVSIALREESLWIMR